MALTRQQVAAHLRAPDAIDWVRLARLLHDRPLSCVDGRDEHAVLGTPGGHAGEYIVLLTVIEALTGKDTNPATLGDSFDRFLDSFGAFYMHTDTHALENLANALAAHPDFADVGTDLAAVEAFVRSPGKRADALLPLLVQPDHVGCGHLKLQLLHPDEYGVRKELVELVIAMVFLMMITWSSSNTGCCSPSARASTSACRSRPRSPRSAAGAHRSASSPARAPRSSARSRAPRASGGAPSARSRTATCTG